MRRVYIFISDLRIGGLIDFKALHTLLLRLQSILRLLEAEERVLIILGSIVEGNKQEFQSLIVHPVLKAKYASYIIKWMVDELAINEAVLVPGDGDLYKYDSKTIISLIKEELEELSVATKVVGEGYIIRVGDKKVMLCHTLREKLREYSMEKHDVDMVICGQHNVYVMTHRLILLPSFRWSSKLTRGVRGGLVITDDGVIIPIFLEQATDYSNPEIVDELDTWLHNIKQKILDKKRNNEPIRLCIDYRGYKKSRKLPRDLYQKIKIMLETGIPAAEIARKLGLDVTAVRFVQKGYEC